MPGSIQKVRLEWAKLSMEKAQPSFPRLEDRMVSWEEMGTVIAKPDKDFQTLVQFSDSFFIQLCVDELMCPMVPPPQ